MGALVGFVSEDTENFLFLLTYTQKNATAFGKKTSKEAIRTAYHEYFRCFSSFLVVSLQREKKAMHRWVIVGESVRGIYEGGRLENRGRCRIVR